MRPYIHALFLSDIHLGHKNTPTSYIIANLNRELADTPKMSDIDIIWLSGDIFDTLLYLPDDHIGEIQYWIIGILRLCVKHDICLRILEGTPSHDRKQSKQFIILNQAYGIGADVMYFDIICIDYMAKFDIHVLYVPDESRSCHLETQNAVNDLLIQHNLAKVDYAIMHGMFEYQTIVNTYMPSHNAAYYLSIVRKYISNGHIHQMSRYDRILVQGSFDRLAHNEEEAKGYWEIISYHNDCDNDRVIFHINKGAMDYISINVVGLSEAEIATKMDFLKDLIPPAHIRIICAHNDPNKALIHAYKSGYVKFKWSIKITETKILNVVHNTPVVYHPIPINQNTIMGIIKEKLTKEGIADDIQNNTLHYLSLLIENN